MLQLSPPRTTLSLGRMPPMVYLRIVEHGSNYKLLDRDLLWKFLSFGRSSKWLHAGRPSCTWTTSFRCTHRLNPNCNSEHLIYQVDDLSGLGQHDERTGDTPMFFFGSPSISNKLVFIQIQFIANEMHICGYAELQIWSFFQKCIECFFTKSINIHMKCFFCYEFKSFFDNWYFLF